MTYMHKKSAVSTFIGSCGFSCQSLFVRSIYLKVVWFYNFFPFRPNFFFRLKNGILEAAASARPLLSF